MSSTNWCFTLNNPTLDEESLMQVSHEDVLYIVYGHEVSESGTPHLQGYMELAKRMAIRTIKRLFSVDRLHLEVRKGTQEQAIAYCLKECSESYERGCKRPGAKSKVSANNKNKLLPYVEEIKKNGITAFASHPDASYHLLKHARDFVAITESPRSRMTKPHVTWYWGPTGTGKTLRAVREAESLGVEPYIRSGNSKFFDGYDGHTFAIFDDFRDSHVEFGFLLRLLDRYPLRVEVKGSSRQWKPSRIVITSPCPPEDCYKLMQSTDKHDKIAQLIRRIDQVVHVTSLPSSPSSPITIPKLCESFSPVRMLYPVDVSSPFDVTPNPRLNLSPPLRRLFDTQTPLHRCPADLSLPSPTQLWSFSEFPAEAQE